MFHKAFFRTAGRAQTVPIPVPISMASLEMEGRSYGQHLWDRWLQMERHCRGFADMGYCLLETHRHRRAGLLSLRHAMLIRSICEIMGAAEPRGRDGLPCRAPPPLAGRGVALPRRLGRSQTLRSCCSSSSASSACRGFQAQYRRCLVEWGIHPELRPRPKPRGAWGRLLQLACDSVLIAVVLPVAMNAACVFANTASVLPGSRRRVYVVAPK